MQLRAPDFASLCEEAGRALAELMLGEDGAGRTEPTTVTVEAESPSCMLYDWLNELIYRSEVDKVVYTDFDVLELTDHRLVARVCGVEPGSIRTAVKAATFHRLDVRETPAGWEATVVFDV